MEKKGMNNEKDKIVCKAGWEDHKMTDFSINLSLRRSMWAIDL
jgi:hypothetical protein